MPKNIIILLQIACLLILVSCRKTKETAVVEKPTVVKEVKTIKPKTIEKSISYEDFDAFYSKFHKDSSFQMSRIKFPLRGYDMDTSENTKQWSKNNWIMHRAMVNEVDTSQYKVDVISKPNYKKEKIYIDGGGFNSERIFKRENGKWYLILFVNEEM